MRFAQASEGLSRVNLLRIKIKQEETMEEFASKNGLSVRAYSGDAMTLLAFDLEQSKTKNFVGFTIQFKAGSRESFIYNRMTFKDDIILPQEPINKNERLSSKFSPIQKFRWVHVPSTRSFIDNPYFGEYEYTITPRYVEKGTLLDIDPNLSVSVSIDVFPFKKGDVSIGFTRAFISSQSYAANFGNKLELRPNKNDLVFDIKQKSGSAKRWNNIQKNFEDVDFTFEEQHQYLGWQARDRVMEFLDEVLNNDNLKLDVFAYDLNEPEIINKLMTLAKQDRVRIILDNYPNHIKITAWETKFQQLFDQDAKDRTRMFRGKYRSQAHSKVFIQRRNKASSEAVKVLTGSTNFTTNGLYINANHTITFENAKVAQIYADVFDNSFTQILMDGFKNSVYASTDYNFGVNDNLPDMTVRFSPHPKKYTDTFFNSIANKILSADSDVLFAIMIDSSNSGILDAVEQQVLSDKIFTYGVTDEKESIQLYKPDSKTGVKISAKQIETNLPKPFNEIVKIPAFGHVIHHKFIVVDFKGKKPVVYCGSSNLAYNPEQKNGDNLLEIRDKDIVTAFAIEAIRLIDHFHWLNRKVDDKKKKLGFYLRDGREPFDWYKAYYKPTDLKYVERTMLIK